MKARRMAMAISSSLSMISNLSMGGRHYQTDYQRAAAQKSMIPICPYGPRPGSGGGRGT